MKFEAETTNEQHTTFIVLILWEDLELNSLKHFSLLLPLCCNKVWDLKGKRKRGGGGEKKKKFLVRWTGGGAGWGLTRKRSDYSTGRTEMKGKKRSASRWRRKRMNKIERQRGRGE